MKKKTSISLSTILIIGLLIYLLLRSQNTNATTTASNASDENTDNDNAKANILSAAANPFYQEKDPILESAQNTGQKIGDHAWPSSSAEIDDAKAGWREAILLWKKYKNAKDETTKTKYKDYVGYLIISVKDRGSKGKSFTERYNHLCWNQGDPLGVSNGAEWKKIWKNFSSDEQNALSEMNSYAQSYEYIRWYQEMD